MNFPQMRSTEVYRPIIKKLSSEKRTFSKVKKILILAYDFPPYVSVGGLRPYAWHKYFRKFGLEPIVVTRQWDPVRQNALDYIAPSEFSTVITEETQWGIVVKAPYKPTVSNRLLLKYGASRFKLLRKTLTFLTECLQFVLPVGPKRPIYLAAKAFLLQNQVDFIIGSATPPNEIVFDRSCKRVRCPHGLGRFFDRHHILVRH